MSSASISTSPQRSKAVHDWEMWYIRLIRYGHSIYCLPICYDPTSSILMQPETKSLRISFVLLIVLTLDCIYLLLISPKVELETVGEVEFVNFWIHTISRILSTFIAWIMAIDRQALVEIYNTTVATRSIWQRRFGSDGSCLGGGHEKRLYYPVKAGVIFCTFQSLFPTAMHVDSRHSARYWGSQILIPRTIYDSPLGWIFGILYDLSLSCMGIYNATCTIILTMIVFLMMRIWTNIIENTTKFRRTDFRRRRYVPFQQYRALQVFSRIQSACLGKNVVPFMIFGGCSLSVLALSAIIKRNLNLSSFILLNLIVSLTLVFIALQLVLEEAAFMLERSLVVKQLFKKEINLYARKFELSCRDMRMNIGEYFFVEKGTFIVNLKWILDQTITIVFAF